MADQQNTAGANRGDYDPSLDPIQAKLELAIQNFKRGKFQESARGCCEILEQNPDHKEAEQLLAACSESMEQQNELDESLGVLDIPDGVPTGSNVSVEAVATNPGIETLSEDSGLDKPSVDPARQNEGIDFGDIDSTASLDLAAPIPHDEPKRGIDGIAQQEAKEQAEPVPETAEGAEDFDLDFAVGDLEDNIVDTPPEVSLAGEGELKGRIQDLLGEAEQLRKEGSYEQALCKVERARILDPSNGAVEALRGVIEKEQTAHSPAILNRLAKADRFIENGEFEKAENIYHSVLDKVEGHPKALAGLSTIESKRNGQELPEDEPLAAEALAFPEGITDKPNEPETSDTKQDLGESAPDLPLLEGLDSTTDGELQTESYPEATDKKTGFSLGALPRWVPYAGIGLAVLVAVFVGWKMLSGERAAPAEEIVTESTQTQQTENTTEQASTESTVASPALPSTAAEAVDQAQTAMSEGDWGQAVLLFNHAKKLDSENLAADQGLAQAVAGYQAQQQLESEWTEVSDYFESGGYSEALRILYRFPEGTDDSRVTTAKVAGWYNLGITSLRAGEPAEAIEHFNEALSLKDDDPLTLERLQMASRLNTSEKSVNYYREVEQLRYREVSGGLSAESVDER